MSTIIFSGGGKGGVGKTAVTLGVVDFLLTKGKEVVLVETDDSNPDAYKSLSSIVTSEVCSMDNEKGYLEFGRIIEKHPKSYIVVNTAARTKVQLENFGGYLPAAASAGNRALIMLWVINRGRDSLELLDSFLNLGYPFTATHAVMNLHFGETSDFSLFNGSNVKKMVSSTIEFPSLNDLIADKINVDRLALSNASDKLHTMEKSALLRYRTAINAAFEGVL